MSIDSYRIVDALAEGAAGGKVILFGERFVPGDSRCFIRRDRDNRCDCDYAADVFALARCRVIGSTIPCVNANSARAASEAVAFP